MLILKKKKNCKKRLITKQWFEKWVLAVDTLKLHVVEAVVLSYSRL